jgi:hypothetical protein
MQKINLFAIIALFFSCSILGPKSNQTNSTFTLKFINTGMYNITGYYLNPGNDTISWGQNLLSVARLDSLQYVFIGNLAKGSDYAMRARFDSAGTTAYLIFTHMATTGPDTISAHAALEPLGYSIGYAWGLQLWPGEQRVGQ